MLTMQAAVPTSDIIGCLPRTVEGFSLDDHRAGSDHADHDRGLRMYENIDCIAYEIVWQSIDSQRLNNFNTVARA